MRETHCPQQSSDTPEQLRINLQWALNPHALLTPMALMGAAERWSRGRPPSPGISLTWRGMWSAAGAGITAILWPCQPSGGASERSARRPGRTNAEALASASSFASPLVTSARAQARPRPRWTTVARAVTWRPSPGAGRMN
jgi:hypothetical protein